MNSGETPSNNQENQERKYTPEENLQYIIYSPTLKLLVEMGIPAIDVYDMDPDTLNDLRLKLEDRLNNPTAPAGSNPETTSNNEATSAVAPAEATTESTESGTSDEGPEITPPIPVDVPPTPESDNPAEAPEGASSDQPPEDGEAQPPENSDDSNLAEATPPVQSEKKEKKKFWTRNRRLGAAVLTIIAAASIFAGSLGMFQNNKNTVAKGIPTPPTIEQMEEESSYEFEIVDTDYRGLFLNADGDNYNPDKESKYAIGTPFPSEFRENNDTEGALEEFFNRLCRQPEHLAMFAHGLSPEYKMILGLNDANTIQDIEAALAEGDNLAWAKEGLREIFMEHIDELEFGESNGDVYSFYMATTGEIQNSPDNIILARSKVIHRNGDDAIILLFDDGTTATYREDCGLQKDIPVEPGTPEDEIEPGTPIITIDIDEPDPTPPTPPTKPDEPTTPTTPEPTPPTKPDPTPPTTPEPTPPDPTPPTTPEPTPPPATPDTPKDPQDIEGNMQTGDESTNIVTPLPAGPETDRPNTSDAEYDDETNQFEDVNSTSERPAEDIVSEDGSGDTVAEIIDNADQTHAEDTNLSAEDQSAAAEQQAANDTEITNTPEMSNDEAVDYYNSQFGSGQ